MVELKPRSASAGKFAGKIRHNQEALFQDEYVQMVAITKTEDKEEQLLFVFNLLKIKPSSDRTATATPEKAKIEANIKLLDAHFSELEKSGEKITKEKAQSVIATCKDELMRKALEQHYFKVAEVQKVPEFVF